MEDVKPYKLVMLNDDDNTFHYVIACLIGKCDHNPIQAEQCATIAHHIGKCHIKSGSFDEMYELRNILEDLDLHAEIEFDESYMH